MTFLPEMQPSRLKHHRVRDEQVPKALAPFDRQPVGADIGDPCISGGLSLMRRRPLGVHLLLRSTGLRQSKEQNSI
jgi:hypothetical protein